MKEQNEERLHINVVFYFLKRLLKVIENGEKLFVFFEAFTSNLQNIFA